MAWVPLRVEADDEPGGGTVRIDAQVEGMLVDLVLDTGAASTAIPERAGVVGVPVSDRRETGTAFGHHTADRVRVESLRLAGFEHGPLVVDLTGGHGQLGLDVLGQHCLDLDLDGGWLGLDEDAQRGPAHRLTLGPSGHPHVALHWGDIEAYCVLDTGASVTVVDAGFAQRHPQLLTPLGTSTGTDAAGITQSGKTWTLSGPSIADVSFAAHTAVVVDLGFVNAGIGEHVDLIVGYPLLRQATWMLNLPGRTWSAQLVS